MSHAATNWAIQQRGLKPTTRIVLWHLCDRFNPDHGCFPSQARLAHDCEISRSTLNAHLDHLEAAGLLRRMPRVHPVTRRQMPTRYILGFEPGFAPDDPSPCPETGHGGNDPEDTFAGPEDLTDQGPAAPGPCPNSGHGHGAEAVSDSDPDPCPEKDQTRVRNPDTNLVREPLRKPVKEEEGAAAREAEFDRFFAELLHALGFDANTLLPAWWQGWPARTHVRRWTQDLGLTWDRILEIARETRRDHPEPPDGPKALDRAMQRGARRDAQAVAAAMARGPVTDSGNSTKRPRKQDARPCPDEDELAAFYADRVNSDAFLPASMISNTICAAMLARGLVTPERLRQRGVL